MWRFALLLPCSPGWLPPCLCAPLVLGRRGSVNTSLASNPASTRALARVPPHSSMQCSVKAIVAWCGTWPARTRNPLFPSCVLSVVTIPTGRSLVLLCSGVCCGMLCRPPSSPSDACRKPGPNHVLRETEFPGSAMISCRSTICSCASTESPAKCWVASSAFCAVRPPTFQEHTRKGRCPQKLVKLLGAVLPLSQELCFAELPHGLHLLDGLFQGLRQHGDVDPACPRFLG